MLINQVHLVSLLLALAHVYLEGGTIVDRLAGVRVGVGLNLTGVVFASHGPAEFRRSVPVDLLVGQLGGESRLGNRGEGGSASEQGGEDDELGL